MRAAFAGVFAAACLSTIVAAPLQAQAIAGDQGVILIGAKAPALDRSPSSSADAVFRSWLQRTDLGRLINRDASLLRVAHAADGTEALVMGEGFHDVLVTAIDERGRTLTTCISTADAARTILLRPAEARVREP